MKGIKQERLLSLLCIGALALVTAPLLILGHYNYPSADDWSLGIWTHQAVLRGEGLPGVLKAAFQTVIYWRQQGEPRYANAFLGALQPGIWGEHYYRITVYLMIGSLIFSEFLLASLLLGKGAEKSGKKWICPILIPSLVLQLLYVPYPVETFYWYVGAVNYTFIFSLSLILARLFFSLADEQMGKCKMISLEILAIFLAVLVGGDSYSASLSAVCLFGTFSILYFWRKRKAFWRTLPITLTVFGGLLVCLMAPGNQVRLNNSFGGRTNGAFYAIWMSVVRTCVNIYSWTSLKIILMVLLTVPFLWLALKKASYNFSYPVLFTVFSFGIYAVQIVPNMFVEGGISECRIADILYYGYHVWILINVGYWIGWLQRRERFKYMSLKIQPILWFCVIGLLLVLAAGLSDLKTTSTYRACAWLVQGKARDYAAMWEERLVLLKDDSVRSMEVQPWDTGTEMIFYSDFDAEYSWFSEMCAAYYNKDNISVVTENR